MTTSEERVFDLKKEIINIINRLAITWTSRKFVFLKKLFDYFVQKSDIWVEKYWSICCDRFWRSVRRLSCLKCQKKTKIDMICDRNRFGCGFTFLIKKRRMALATAVVSLCVSNSTASMLSQCSPHMSKLDSKQIAKARTGSKNKRVE